VNHEKRGGPNRGQGRKPLNQDGPSVLVSVRLTPAQRDKLRELGGGVWIRAQIAGAVDVKKTRKNP
jgi:hypothetical protein